MADGKVRFAYSRFMGVDKDKETGKIVVNPEQTEVVRLIFHLFLEGMTPHSIAAELTNRGIKTPGGKDVWNQQTVRRLRRVVWIEGLAFHRPLSQSHLPLQPKVQR